MALIQFKHHQFSLKLLIFVISVAVPSTASVFRKKQDSYPDTHKLSRKEAAISEVTRVDFNNWTPGTTTPFNEMGRGHAQFFVQSGSRNTTIPGKDANSSDTKVARYPYYRKAQSDLAIHSEMEYISSQAYNNSENNYNDFNYNNSGTTYRLFDTYRDYQDSQLNTNQAYFLPPPGPTVKTTSDVPFEQNDNRYDDASSDPNYYWDELQYIYLPQAHAQPSLMHQLWQREEENESLEIEDKVFSKTVVAAKALKVGKIIFTFFMGLVVLAIAGLGKLGIAVSPVVLPLALFPIGVIALLLFIPLFAIFVPHAATGVIGERKKRRKRRNADSMNMPTTTILDSLLLQLIDKLPTLLNDWKDWKGEE